MTKRGLQWGRGGTNNVERRKQYVLPPAKNVGKGIENVVNVNSLGNGLAFSQGKTWSLQNSPREGRRGMLHQHWLLGAEHLG